MLGRSVGSMFLLILLFSSGKAIHDDSLTPGIDTQSYPSCFAFGTTWSTEESVDIIEETPSLYSCQDLCFQFPSCHKFTWYNAKASSLAFSCFFFSSPTTKFPCSNCVSGPPSCTCDMPKPQEHGDWFCPPSLSPSIPPSTCHLDCHPGYASNNGTVVMCLDGAWSSSPTCVEAVALITGSWDDPQNTVEVYSSGLHFLLPDLPDARASHSLDLVDSTILLCGGDTSTGTSCLRMTSSHLWVPHSTLPSDRMDHSSVSALGQLHLLGGGYPSSRPSSEYLPWSSTTWSSGWELLEDTWGACAAKVEPELVVTTGGDTYSTSVVSYNVTSGAVTRLQDLISPRYRHGCCYIRNEGFRGVLVAGGGGGDYDLSQLYDLSSGEWSPTGKLTTGRAQGVRLFVIGDHILGSGGAFGGSSVDRFNITSRTWEPVDNMLEERAYHAVTIVPPSAVGVDSD